MQFIDEAKIYIKSGDGGSGCVSFRHEKCIEFGGPDGGNGGQGGDVVIKSTNRLNTLIDFRYKQHFKAENGRGGKGKNKTGASGKNIIINVPIGTQLLTEDKKNLLFDFTKEDEQITVIKGGKGGYGNAYYKSSTNRAPRRFHPGDLGQEMCIWLNLKLIADVGIIGLPNAGKSTFLSVISNAKPKIGEYPFSTLAPQLGIVKQNDQVFTIADTPGLIKNAHKGVGLGHRFLSHIERCHILLHMLDMTSNDVVASYKTIRQELIKYNKNLSKKIEIIVLNKSDLLSKEEIDSIRDNLLLSVNRKIIIVSSISRVGINEVKKELFDHLYKNKSNVI